MREPTGVTDPLDLDVPVGQRVLLVLDGARVQVAPLPRAGRVGIGRSPACDIVIDAQSVSRHHADLQLGPDEISITDLGSKHGISVGGRTLGKDETAPLTVGAPFLLGGVTLMVQVRKAPRSTATPSERRAEFEGRVLSLASGRLPVLLVGEAGVGKEQIAERIHELSGRRAGSFIRIQCGSEPHVERELFGTDRVPGLVEAADGGSVLLVDIDLLPGHDAIVRLIDDKLIARGGRDRSVDVRVMATARAPLANRDLAARFTTGALAVPPLRERKDEVAEIAERMLRAAVPNGPSPMLTRVASHWISEQEWPGNLHELRNTCERAALLSAGAQIDVRHLTEARTQDVSSSPQSADAVSLEQRKMRIVDALSRCAGNQTRAAALLGISRRTLSTWLDEHGLSRPSKRDV